MQARTAFKFAALLAAVGFINAAYLSVLHFVDAQVVCSLLLYCDKVLRSAYADMRGIPVALIGVFYYLTLFVLAFGEVRAPSKRRASALALISGTGFLVSIFFVYLQWQVIREWCTYCLLSAVATTFIFLLSVYAIWKFRNA